MIVPQVAEKLTLTPPAGEPPAVTGARTEVLPLAIKVVLPKLNVPTVDVEPLIAKSTVVVRPPTAAVTVAAPELVGVAGATVTEAWPLFPVAAVVFPNVTALPLVVTENVTSFELSGTPLESV